MGPSVWGYFPSPGAGIIHQSVIVWRIIFYLNSHLSMTHILQITLQRRRTPDSFPSHLPAALIKINENIWVRINPAYRWSVENRRWSPVVGVQQICLWPLIGLEWSGDQDTGLWLVDRCTKSVCCRGFFEWKKRVMWCEIKSVKRKYLCPSLICWQAWADNIRHVH